MMKTSAVLAGLLVPALAAAQPASPAPSPPPWASPAPAPTPAPTSGDVQPAPVAPMAPSAGPPVPAGTVSAAPVAAPGMPVAAPSLPELESRPGVRLGAEAALLPLGTLSLESDSNKLSADTNVTFGLGAVLQIPLSDVFTFDLAPRIVFNVKSDGDTDSATEYDLRVRLTAGGNVTPGTRLYAALEPGYSFLSLPFDAPAGVDMSTPAGLSFGLAAGAVFRTAPGVHFTTEVGYQFGFQGTTVSAAGQSIDIDVTASFLHVAVGVLFDL